MSDIHWTIGRATIRAGNTLWREGLLDVEENYDRLADLHREAHIGWVLDSGEYEEDEDFWCGVFAAWCYAHVGDHLLDNVCVDLALRADVATYMFASPERLVGRGTRAWSDLDLPEPREVSPDEARAGDIGLVSASESRPHGSHVTLIADATYEEPDEDSAAPPIRTLEGNASGLLFGGERTPSGVEAVVHNERDKDAFAHILRPQVEWFAGAYLEELV